MGLNKMDMVQPALGDGGAMASFPTIHVQFCVDCFQVGETYGIKSTFQFIANSFVLWPFDSRCSNIQLPVGEVIFITGFE